MKRTKTLRWLELLVGPAVLLLSQSAHAAECWQVTGWNGLQPRAEAELQEADCSTTPERYGWTRLTDFSGDPPDEPLFVRLSLDDPSVNSWGVFGALLRFHGYDTTGVPVVSSDIIPHPNVINETQLSPNPPEQGVPNAGARVRLRHRQNGTCMRSVGQNGAGVDDQRCSFDSSQIYVLDNAGDGTYRIRHENSDQCLYAWGGNGGPINNWGCWSDPNMRFVLEDDAVGYRLRHVSSGQCAYSTSGSWSSTRHWGCWDDDGMEYLVDIVEYGGWTDWIDEDYGSAPNDLEFGFAYRCPGPEEILDIECRTTDGVDWTLTGETLRCSDMAMLCYGVHQDDGECEDYEVRFLCG